MSPRDIKRAEACERIYVCIFILILLGISAGWFGA